MNIYVHTPFTTIGLKDGIGASVLRDLKLPMLLQEFGLTVSHGDPVFGRHMGMARTLSVNKEH